jgi:phi13 family phage major tail protein
MSQLVGCESARIGIFNAFDDEHIDPTKIFSLNAAVGSLLGANIQNLGYQTTIQYGSDTVFRVSGKGHGAITCALTANDIPDSIIAQITGETVPDSDGIYKLGKDTQAPYCALELISHDIHNNMVYLALLKGIFTHGDINPQTNQAQETDATDAITFTSVDRISDGLAYAHANSGDTGFTETAWNSFVFPPVVGG